MTPAESTVNATARVAVAILRTQNEMRRQAHPRHIRRGYIEAGWLLVPPLPAVGQSAPHPAHQLNSDNWGRHNLGMSNSVVDERPNHLHVITYDRA